jgi:metallo-beta-lactamase family protein
MAKAKQRKPSVKLTLHGKNSTDVTGSFTTLNYKDYTIAIDCGGFQGTSKLKTYQINKNMFKDVSLKSISSILLSHLNFDHQNSIPTFFNQGGNATVYMVEGSYRISELMFKDSMRINISDCEYLTKKYNKEFSPLYTEEDVEKALYNTIEYKYGEKFRINQYMEVEFVPAGHIYLSAQIIVYVEDGNFKRKILFSGDLGNPQIKKPTVEPFVKVKSANLCLCETTYAMAENKCTQAHKEKDLILLGKKIKKTCGNKNGKVLIASFALQRSLDILMDLYTVWETERFSYPIYLDTPLGVQILQIIEHQTNDPLFEKLNNWENLRFVTDYNNSKSVLYSDEPAIVIASSGFAQGGRILMYFTQILPNKKHCLITAGYSSPESNMGQVKQRIPLSIMNEGELKEYEVKCDIVELQSFSSHMQHNDMIDYYTSIQCDKLVLNHGDSKNKYEFAELLDEELSKKCKTTKVYILGQNEYVEI